MLKFFSFIYYNILECYYVKEKDYLRAADFKRSIDFGETSEQKAD